MPRTKGAKDKKDFRVFNFKPGRKKTKEKELIGKKFAGWKIVACSGQLSKNKKDNYWTLESPDKTQRIVLRQDYLSKFKGKNIKTVKRNLTNKKH